jgi:capsular exopolysaccharide synthesis family protein
MDRLSKALEKARADRALVASQEQATPAGPAQDEQLGTLDLPRAPVRRLDPKYLEAHRVLLDGGGDAATSAFKLLRTQVGQRMAANGWQTLVVTSPSQGNGKTVTAINLAVNLARQSHQSVLLVDLDLRRPSIQSYLSPEPAPGLSDYLSGQAKIEDVLYSPGIDGLTVLPGREAVAHSSEALLHEETLRLIRKLRSRYAGALMIFDMPPVLSVDDVVAFSPHWDAALLVIEDGQSTAEEIRSALDLLKPKPVLGTVLTKSEDAQPEYEY